MHQRQLRMKQYDKWLLTNSGRCFNLLDPKPEDINVQDIAKSLSKLCRYVGHPNHFYSVGDHILNGRVHVPPQYVKYWDLHDAEEAYLGDIPTPLKSLLGPKFDAIQQGVHKAVCERFDLDPNFPSYVKRNDLRMLLAEREALFDAEALVEPWDIDYNWALNRIPYKHVKIKIQDFNKTAQELYNVLIRYA